MTFPERHVLKDGTNVVLRPIQPGDRDELKRGFEHLSSESRYRRFFAAVVQLCGSTSVNGFDCSRSLQAPG